MKHTDRELAASHRLGEAILEFFLAWEEGKSRRQPPARVLPPVKSPSGPITAGQDVEPVRKEAPDHGASSQLLSVKEAATFLSIGERLLWSMTAPRGPIRSVRLSNRAVRYSMSDLEAAIAKLRTRPWRDARTPR